MSASIPPYLLDDAQRLLDKVSMVYPARQITFAALCRETPATAECLRDMEMRTGDSIGIEKSVDQVAAPPRRAGRQCGGSAAPVESEVRSILNAIFEMSGETFLENVHCAVQFGYLDLLFPPRANNANLLVTMREANRSICIADPGKVPISAYGSALERRLLLMHADCGEKAYRQLSGHTALMM